MECHTGVLDLVKLRKETFQQIGTSRKQFFHVFRSLDATVPMFEDKF